MLIFKKEKHARKLALEHFAKTHECLQMALNVMREYLDGELETARESAIKVITLETEADTLKRELRDVLFSGAFLPNIRSDVYRLVDKVDAVANKGESASRFIVNQNPNVPEDMHKEMENTFALCFSCYQELHQGLKCFFKPKGEMENLREHTASVGQLETEVDNLQAKLTRRIFSSSLEKAEKIHLCQLLTRIARIADAAEDAADELQYAAMKSVI